MPFKKEIYNTLYTRVDPWIMQTPQIQKDHIFQGMVSDLETGYSLALEKDGVVFYFVPENEWFYRMHLFSTTDSVTKGIAAGNYLTSQIFDLMPKLQKVYGITPLKSLIRVSEKFGWKHEGTIVESFMTKEGVLKDQYVFGVTKKENEIWRTK